MASATESRVCRRFLSSPGSIQADGIKLRRHCARDWRNPDAMDGKSARGLNVYLRYASIKGLAEVRQSFMAASASRWDGWSEL